MEYFIDEKIIHNAIEKYGKEKQSIVCMEECSELIQSISKLLRGGNNLYNLTEEIADVIICIETLKQIYNIGDLEIQTIIVSKQGRMLDRLYTGEN